MFYILIKFMLYHDIHCKARLDVSENEIALYCCRYYIKEQVGRFPLESNLLGWLGFSGLYCK